MRFFGLLLLLILGYYFLAFSFFTKAKENEPFPYLRTRLGTILYKSSTPPKDPAYISTVEHIYCYYPSENVSFQNKGGEYIIKRVDSYQDCSGWHGATVFREGAWVSEVEKLWWNTPHKLEEALVEKNQELRTI